jgi:formate dehydrogenase subunit beta
MNEINSIRNGNEFLNGVKGAIFSAKDIEEGILEFLKTTLDKNLFDALLIPMKVPAGDSFAWVLLEDRPLLKDAAPLSPIMPVQGAKAVCSLTRRGNGKKKIAVIMRPCEIRATIELFKLKQVELENIFLISIDCPGVLPLSLWLENPEKGKDIFKEVLKQWGGEAVRPVCKICDKSSMIASDLHIGMLGRENGNIFLIPGSNEGKTLLDKLDVNAEEDMSDWDVKVKALKKEREQKKSEAYDKLKAEVEGTDKLLKTLSKCINCHNCMRVCPICYCRQCYFDSDALKLSSENYLMRAQRKGGLRFLPDTALFHLGRMSHMALSCVSCGTCEDACPMSIPVAQIFSLVGEKAQKTFDYLPGKDKEEPLPLVAYKEEEFHDVEKPYVETYSGEE